MWTIYFHLKGCGDEDDDFIECKIERVNLTYPNMICFKEQFGYASRDYLYYKKRCGVDIATIEPIDYSQHAKQMLRDNAKEKEIRFIISLLMHFLNHSFIHDLLLHAHVQPY
jgi:hypothetical protein